MKTRWFCFSLVLFVFVRVACGADERHILLVVWDGMRPDFVTEKAAPTLNGIAQAGVRFSDQHAVYLTATDVNGTALATGVYPTRSSLFANMEFYPAINLQSPVEMSDPQTVAAGDRATGGRYLAVSTLAEELRGAGRKVALAGAKAVAALFDRHNDWALEMMLNQRATIFAAAPVSPALREEITRRLGPFLVEPTALSASRNTYVTRTLTEVLWRDGVSDFSVLWLSEPDLSQHRSAPGSPQALAAIKSSDDCLALILAALERKKARANTDIMVVSDHGFSTIQRSVDFFDLMNAAGLHAVKEFSDESKTGDILLDGNGGSVLFYVRDHDRAVVQKLVSWLQHQDFAGVVFTREGMEGTFPLGAAHIDTAQAADVVLAMRWSDGKNQFGVPGLLNGDWNRAPGYGTHASLSRFDLRNTLIAQGPDFRRGFVDELPTGNIDVAPTIAHILRFKASGKFDGRVLTEAMTEAAGPASPQTRTLEASRDFPEGRWRQTLRLSTVGGTEYVGEGNGAFTTK